MGLPQVNLGRVLLLSPHRDDEVLGCGGLIGRLDPNELHIFYFNDAHPNVDRDKYSQEASNIRIEIGCIVGYSKHMWTNRLDTSPIASFVDEIERHINMIAPDTLLIPFPSYNQDHRVIFEAAITASRVHDKNWYVKNIFVYEQPETIQTNRLEPRFIPHLFIEIDIEEKIKLYQIYESQQRGHRSPDHLRYLAGVRGMQCNKPFAEAFMIVRQTL